MNEPENVDESWSDRVERFWSTADDSDPDDVLSRMKALVEERPEGDADATYEWASAHDFIGQEEAAIPLYRAAIARGLDEEKRHRALIQLGSSLRNVGELDDAMDVLEQVPRDSATGDAARAFLSLVLHDAGRHSEALRIALTALAPTLPLYGRSVSAYAAELTAGTPSAST